jgi:hypothetical protein
MKVYYVDGRDLKDEPTSSYDVAMLYQPAVEEVIEELVAKYEELVTAIKGNCHDNIITRREESESVSQSTGLS